MKKNENLPALSVDQFGFRYFILKVEVYIWGRLVKIKVVFQGGGARLSTLIAAADALRDLCDAKDIEVERVVGVSAGSIAAAMFACDRSIETQRLALQQSGSEIIEKLKTPGTFSLVWKIFRGKAIFDESLLDPVLANVLQSDGKPVREISSLKFPTTIVASDVRYKKLTRYTEGSDAPLNRAIRDSCSFPFAFRSFSNESHIVDGGLCANLPSDLVVDGKPVDDDAENVSRVIAFSFEKQAYDGAAPKNVLDFARALFATTIEHSVDAAAERVRQSGGAVCELPEQFDTFEFKKALEEGLSGSDYDFAYGQAKRNLEKIFNRFDAELSNSGSLVTRENIAESVNEAHRNLMRLHPCTVVRDITIVEANSLFPDSDPLSELPDTIHQIAFYQASKQSILAVRIGIPNIRSEEQEGRTCVVRDNTGKIVECRQVPVSVLDPETRQNRNSLLIFFNKPIDASKCPVRVAYQFDHLGSLQGVNSVGLEWLRGNSGAVADNASVEQLVYCKPGATKIRMEDLLENAVKLPQDMMPHDHETMGEHWKKGEAMSEEEASTKLYEILGDAPGGELDVYGWKCDGVGPNTLVGTLLSKA